MAGSTNGSIAPYTEWNEAVIVAVVFVGLLSVTLLLLLLHACVRSQIRLAKNDAGRDGGDCENTHPDDSMLEEKESGVTPTSQASQTSFTLSPDQPVVFDVDTGRGYNVEIMQVILTPPTPAKERGDKGVPVP
ncbi:hypothetical protein HETIRDRAFT_115217 [Heterobasidion irregulare TC 32-1]|uniref:Uncharacterized protein n=1 Tax=Heterobasidion irregulare (strain TC 32-1) TaxID=747525 RepID=W4KIM9_HETIT|nr:uncharacterized protein HETIRDRAFT_115217 [Heterobasidion irregulare TC 32-1]ETW85564.1 hypothetical protein HETIRDRAFT_115217 [Heterobasidion irregulare TC 32-1]